MVAELNQLSSRPRILILTEDSARINVEVHFVPASSFSGILSQYVPGNRGFFWIMWNGRNEIVSATVLIDNSTAISQSFRNHLIREEITQILGLGRDSPRFPGSIFFDQGLPAPTEYLDIDRTIIRIHMLAEVQAGMTEQQVRGVLSSVQWTELKG